MSETRTEAAAHVITSEAVALGDPEIIIMTRDEDGAGAEEIERVALVEGPNGPVTDVPHLQMRTWAFGWRAVGEVTEVEPGYYIWNVEKV